MLTRPQLRTCYQAEIVDGQYVLLLAERGNHLLRGRAYAVVAQLLDGTRSVAEIVDAAAPAVSAPEVYYVLQRLEQRGCIREAGGPAPQASAAFWDAAGVAPAAAGRIQGFRIALTSLNGIPDAPLAAALADLGIETAAEGELTLVLVDDYLHPGLAEINTRSLRLGRPWLLAKPVGSLLWIGPLLQPGATGCWECLAQRLRASRTAESFLQARRGDAEPRVRSISALPSTTQAAWGLIATEVGKWIAQAPGSDLEGTLLTFDLATFTSERHVLVRRPQCAACGTAVPGSQLEPNPVRLASRLRSFAAETGSRALSPEETLRRYQRHISPLIGVVSHLQRETSVASDAVSLYYSGQNSAIRDDSLHFLRDNFRSRCGGKGKSESQAKASALCEAIERYSGVFQGDEIRVRGSLRELGPAALHPNACMHFSEAQYAGRYAWNAARARPFLRVPEPFDEEAELEWVPLWSLTGETHRFLPAAYCYYGYPLPPERRFCYPDSNGCAAGNSLEEAILQGFLELVERDCVALWWFNRVRRPAVDLDSFDEPYFRTLRQYYLTLHRELWVLDLTHDLGIPAFAALARRTDATPEDIIYGFAAHFDPRVGVLRALAEMNQSLPIVLERHANPAAPYRFDDEIAQQWLRTSSLENRPYLVPATGGAKRAEDYPRWERYDLKDAVEDCVRIAAAHGMETLVLDQTRPDVGLPVAKVVVPGLRQFWPRFGPGRLFDGPVALGWVPAPLREEDLNPMSIFF